jgi:alkylhydroperoxidase family enzyme
MTRIPTHTVEDAPELARPLLQEMVQFSPTGRPLNLHAQLAHAPAVLAAYVGLRKTATQYGTLDQQVRPALMLAAAAATDSEYAKDLLATLALRSGWRADQVEALRAGKDVGEAKTDALVAVVRQAAADRGRVGDQAWRHALASGWTDDQLAEAFAYLGLAVYTGYFLNYAQTERDLPMAA